MDRLTTLTADLADMHLRQAALVHAVASHFIGTDDPIMLANFMSARQVHPSVQLLVKAATPPLDTTGGLAPSEPTLRAVLAAVDRRSVLGQINAIKVPSANTLGATQTATAVASWVGEAGAKPLRALAFAAMSLPPRKLAADVAVSEELIKFAMADALALVERSVTSACAAALDSALLDPANAGTASVKPASLTNGLTAITGTGDFANQVGQVLAGISGGAPTRPVLIVSIQGAVRLAAFPGLRDYLRVVVTPAVTGSLVAIDADGVAWCDDGGALKIGEPDIQMDDAPVSTPTAATVLAPTWQRNLKVVRCERWTNWAKRADAVALLTLA